MQIINKIQEYAIYILFFSLNFESMNLFGLNIPFLATKISIVILYSIAVLNVKTTFNFSSHGKQIVTITFFLIFLTYRNYAYTNESYTDFFNHILFINITIYIILGFNNKNIYQNLI